MDINLGLLKQVLYHIFVICVGLVLVFITLEFMTIQPVTWAYVESAITNCLKFVRRILLSKMFQINVKKAIS
jgi:hypothetical protein